MSSILSITSLSKTFSGLSAVNNVTFSIEKGQIYGLIGPNGAGKTTVFNLITGIYKPTSGSIKLLDNEISGLRPDKITQMGVCRTFQNLRLFRKQTVFDNILIASQLRLTPYNYADTIFRTPRFLASEEKAKKKARELLAFVGLEKMALDNALSLPYGMQRKLEIARALATDPILLLFDEPAAGMNPDESRLLMDLISSIRKEYDITILLIEHHMEVVMGICDRISVLNFGNQIAQGTADEIQNDQTVIEAYLGQEV